MDPKEQGAHYKNSQEMDQQVSSHFQGTPGDSGRAERASRSKKREELKATMQKETKQQKAKAEAKAAADSAPAGGRVQQVLLRGSSEGLGIRRQLCIPGSSPEGLQSLVPNLARLQMQDRRHAVMLPGWWACRLGAAPHGGLALCRGWRRLMLTSCPCEFLLQGAEPLSE